MGGRASQKKVVDVASKSLKNKKSVPKGKLPKKAVSASTKAKIAKSKPSVAAPKKITKKVAAKPAKKTKAPKFTYESLILDHRENGRKLARSILRKWRVHMPGEEVDSIVDLALCESSLRFSPSKGASFMTFFFYHLRGHLVRAVARATQSSAILNGPKSDEWCDDGHSEFASSYGAYLDNEMHNQRDNETPEQIVLRREKITVCREAIDKLDKLEQVVLDKSYAEDEALVNIAKSLGYSRCHISRVKKGALQRLKSVLEHSTAMGVNNLNKIESDGIKLVRKNIVKLERKTRRKNNSDSSILNEIKAA